MCIGMANGGKCDKMSQFSDEQIIGWLECCVNAESCLECAFTKMCDGKTINQLTLDLINRQQKQLDNYSHNVMNMSKDFLVQQKIIQEQRAEIQTLREDIHNRKARENKLRSKIKSFKTEIERLQEELEIRNQKRASIFEISNAYERGRAETIKELEAKIHEKLYQAEMHGNFEPVVTREMFDSVIKEVVGEGK